MQLPSQQSETVIYFYDSTVTPLGWVSMAGQHKSGSGTPQWRVLQTHALIFPISGRARLESDGMPATDVGPGDLFWIFPGVKYGISPCRFHSGLRLTAP